MRIFSFPSIIAVFFGVLLISSQQLNLRASPLEEISTQGFLYRDYFLYLPQKIDPNKTYWLVCYAHGAQGHVAQDLTIIKYFSEREDCIVIAPTFSRGYQLLEHNADGRVIEIFEELKKKYHLHNKFFILGHSAGGQFAHRFTLKHPDLITGCAAFSSGTWATGSMYHSLNPEAEDIPLAIACGAEDQSRIGRRIAFLLPLQAVNNSEIRSWTRIEWFEKFKEQLQEKKFFFKAEIFPGEAHHLSSQEQVQLASESFLLGTSGMLPAERAEDDHEIAIIESEIEHSEFDQAQAAISQLQLKKNNRSLEEFKNSLSNKNWQFNEKGIQQCLEAFTNFIDESTLRLQNKMEAKKILYPSKL